MESAEWCNRFSVLNAAISSTTSSAWPPAAFVMSSSGRCSMSEKNPSGSYSSSTSLTKSSNAVAVDVDAVDVDAVDVDVESGCGMSLPRAPATTNIKSSLFGWFSR